MNLNNIDDVVAYLLMLLLMLVMVVIIVAVFQRNLLIHIFIYNFCFVNSPLLLELPPCGQVQVAKDR